MGSFFFFCDVLPCDSVEDLKSRIHARTGIPPDRLFLMYRGKQLRNGLKLSDYNIRINNPEVVLTLHAVGMGACRGDGGVAYACSP